MTIIETDPDGVIAHRLDGGDPHIFFAGHCLPLVGAMTLNLGARAEDAQIFGRKGI